MDLKSFMNRCAIANGQDECVNSLILIYTDNHTVAGPYIGVNSQADAYERAVGTGRPFRFQLWSTDHSED